MSKAIVAEVNPSFLTTQECSAYTSEDHGVWSILYRRRMPWLREHASRVYLAGAEAIGLEPDCVPNLDRLNAQLEARTGWTALPVTGFLPAREFFVCLAHRRFPTTVEVRPKEELDYTPQPDIFHDVFGHVPLHADPVFADFLQAYGVAASEVQTDEDVTRMGRLFWFTVEFGLIREDGKVKVYGSGLVSSHEDGANALGPNSERRPFSLGEVLDQPVHVDRLQNVLFVIESFDELFDAVEECKRLI